VSSYDDPRWYEQPEHFPQNDANQLPAPDENGGNLGQGGFNTNDANRPDQQNWIRQQPASDPSVAKKRNRSGLFGQIVVTLALMVIAFLAGWFGHQVFSTPSFNANNPSQSYLSLFDQAWNIVNQNYVDRKAVNYKQMSYQAIEAMLNVLGDTGHTRFLTPQEVQAENQQLSGSFVGIGIYLEQDPKTQDVIITGTIPGSPAEKVGFKSGDIIIAVNGTNVAGKSLDAIHSLIDGPAGTSVSITVKRPSTNSTLTIKVTREQITVPNVIMHYIAQDHIADIQIAQFSDGTSSQLKAALTQAKKLGATKIILDLRDNPGGYLQEAIDTASEFMGGNKTVLIEQDSSGNRKADLVTGQTVDTADPIVVLVNGNTASAAEIVSGALQDNHRAIVMGTKTFGTGTVLQEFDLADGSAILLGTSEWLTPDGQFIRSHGITPNITVNLTPKATELTPTIENQQNMTEQQILNSGDNQLVSAIKYLEGHP
jgi:carboxyl-terminal processing protease